MMMAVLYTCLIYSAPHFPVKPMKTWQSSSGRTDNADMWETQVDSRIKKRE